MKAITALVRIVAVVAALAAFGCAQRYSHDDFVNLIKNKTPAEVESRVGKPDAVDESVAGSPQWTYKDKTFTTDGGTKFDHKAIVIFHQEDAALKVAEVRYE